MARLRIQIHLLYRYVLSHDTCCIRWDRVLLRVSKAGVTNHQREVDDVNDRDGQTGTRVCWRPCAPLKGFQF